MFACALIELLNKLKISVSFDVFLVDFGIRRARAVSNLQRVYFNSMTFCVFV
jgi:hypothetical protein